MPRILTSWKEIGQYLGKGVRTVQRWEREADLPVRRDFGRTSHSIIAIAEELEAWARGHPRRQSSAHEAALQREIANLRANNAELRTRLDAVEAAVLAMIGGKIAAASSLIEHNGVAHTEHRRIHLAAQQSRAEAIRARLAFASALCALSETSNHNGNGAELQRARQSALRIRRSLEQPGVVPLHELNDLRDLHRKLSLRIEGIANGTAHSRHAAVASHVAHP